MMFFSDYFLRYMFTVFFVKQIEAEKTSDSLDKILDNLPDAVLMLESSELSYCNQQADNFFGVKLSNVEILLKNSTYVIMDKRCLHELHT